MPVIEKLVGLTRRVRSSAAGSEAMVRSTKSDSASGDGVRGMQPIILSVSRPNLDYGLIK